jgi:lipoate-protein ligase A
MPLFKVTDLFLDETGRGGPEQMALDESLIESAERPLLRLYRWSGQAVSFGYSQSLATVRERFRSIPCVRRWTGGGIVEHATGRFRSSFLSTSPWRKRVPKTPIA